ncbi:Uma2 family endonuclease [Streptomyces toxytricini]
MTPPADGRHALTLTWLTERFYEAGARKAGLRYVQNIGIWLPTGADDFAIPDFSLVEADFTQHRIAKNCYAPDVFRLVIEVTSSNWSDDVGVKVDSYARAGVPAYVIADRHHDEAVLCSDLRGGAYRLRRTLKRGESVTVPEHVGVSLELPVDLLLDGDPD